MPDIRISEAIRRRHRLRRYALIGVGVAVVLLAFLLLPSGPAVPRSDLLIATVKSGRLAIRVQAPGTLEPRIVRWVTAAVPGVVEDVRVEPGDRVQAGSILAVLGNPRLQSERVTARLNLATAETNRVSLRARLENQLLALRTRLAATTASARVSALQAEAERGLVAAHVVSKLDYERSRLDSARDAQTMRLTREQITAFRANLKAQLQAQQAKIDALKAALAERQTEVNALKVRAGLAGVVQAIAAQAGQTLTLGGNLARIASLRRLKAVLQVAPSQAGEVTVGQYVRLSLNVGSGAGIAGRIKRVAPAVANGSVAVDVALPGKLPDGARPNLSVSGIIAIATLTHTFYVQRPVYSRADSTLTLYRLIDGGSAAVPVRVRFGRASDQAIQILSGLEPGERVIVSDTSSFAGTKRVRIQ